MRKLLILLIVPLILLAACSNGENKSNESAGQEEQANEEIVLNAVSFLPKDHELTKTLHTWIENIEEATEGRVKVDWRGGEEVIPVGEQFEALDSGVIDINFTYVGQYQTQLPESLALPLSQITPWEERENGFYDFMVERHETIGVKYIGRWLTGSPRLWLNDPISSVDELKNKKIRSAPNYNRFFDELGITSVMIDPSEVYTSLQTGIVDGFVYGGLSGPRQDGWTDSSKYVLDIPFWTQNCVILFNEDSWDQIDEKDQEAIMAATWEYEKEMVAYYEDIFEEERQELLDIGVEFITLSEEDTEYFLDLAYDTEWDYIATEEPEIVEEIRHLTESE